LRKSIIILIMASCMLFGSGMAAIAHSLYFDGTLGGKWKTGNNEDELSAYIIGGEYFIGSQSKFKIGGEYTRGTEELYSDDGDFTVYLIKGGYQLFATGQFRVDFTLGYYNRNYSELDEETDGILAGADVLFQIGKKSYVQASFGYSLTGKSGDDADLMRCDAKYVYLFHKNLGASAGYRYFKISLKETDDYLSHSGPTLGVIYRF
jgi:hypothetical protein